VALILIGLFYAYLLGQDPVSSVNVAIDPNTGIGPEENELRFIMEASRSYLSRDETFQGGYSIIYDNATVEQGTFPVTKQGKSSVAVNFTEFYRDNGLYTVQVIVEGKTGSDSVEIIRTVHGLSPTMTDISTTYRLGLGLRPTDEPDDDRVVTTKGHGSAFFYYVEQGNDTADPGDWELVERVIFDIDLTELTYRIQSDDRVGTTFIDLGKAYLTEKDNGQARTDGRYAARITFHNDFSDDPLAFDEPVVALTDWLFVDG